MNLDVLVQTLPDLRLAGRDDKLRWSHPGGPFEYLFSRDAGTGAWRWAMRNTLLDSPGEFTSEGDLEGLPALPTEQQLAAAIQRFTQAEIVNLRD